MKHKHGDTLPSHYQTLGVRKQDGSLSAPLPGFGSELIADAA